MGFIFIGTLMRPKEDVWIKWCIQHQKEYLPFKPQPVIAAPGHSPYNDDYVMLAFPFYWWHKDDLEEAPVD